MNLMKGTSWKHEIPIILEKQFSGVWGKHPKSCTNLECETPRSKYREVWSIIVTSGFVLGKIHPFHCLSGGKKSRNQRKKGKDEETKPRCKEKVLIKILRLNFKFQDEISESLTDPETRMTNEYGNIPKYMQMRQFQAPSLQRHRNPCEAQQVGSFSSLTPALPANSSTLESFPPPAKVCLEAARGS